MRITNNGIKEIITIFKPGFITTIIVQNKQLSHFKRKCGGKCRRQKEEKKLIIMTF